MPPHFHCEQWNIICSRVFHSGLHHEAVIVARTDRLANFGCKTEDAFWFTQASLLNGEEVETFLQLQRYSRSMAIGSVVFNVQMLGTDLAVGLKR